MEAIGPVLITVLVVGGIAWALWQEHREKQAAEPSRSLPANARGPAALAALPLPVPALEADGGPLSDEEQAVLDQVQWDSDWIGIQDARYGRKP